jgi:hypothetical protein
MIVYMLRPHPEVPLGAVGRLGVAVRSLADGGLPRRQPGSSALGRRVSLGCAPDRAAVAILLAELSLRFAGRTVGATRGIAAVDRAVAVVVNAVAADFTPKFAVQSTVAAALTDLTAAGPTAERAL